jgi:hypothetical protein
VEAESLILRRELALCQERDVKPRRLDAAAWSTFLHSHARAIVACDFFVAVTATFRLH